MKVRLMVDWEAKEILTVKELDERIDDRFEEVMQSTEAYNEGLDDYLDCNYSKMELFEALSGSDAEREEVLADIRAGVAEAVYDWVRDTTSSDFLEVIIEV
jgi:hypothetical protein